jgi:hypothetical protein
MRILKMSLNERHTGPGRKGLLTVAGTGLAAFLGAGWLGVWLWNGGRPPLAEGQITSAPAATSAESRPGRSADPALPPEQFDQLWALVKPRPGEAAWEEIPWMTDLWEARKKAAAEGKPLYVWSASADVLGCT